MLLILSEEVRSRAEFLFLRSKMVEISLTEEQGGHWDAATEWAQLAKVQEIISEDSTFYGGYSLKATILLYTQQIRGAISAAKEAWDCASIPSDYASQIKEVIGIGVAMKNSGVDKIAELESTGGSVEEYAIFERTCCVCNEVSESPKSGGSSKKKKKAHMAAAMTKCEGCTKSPDSLRCCSQTCQLQHWTEHKEICSKDTASKKQSVGVELS